MPGFFPAPKPEYRPKKKPAGIPKKNVERAKKSFEEDFDSRAYVEAIHALSCAICGVAGWTEAAHTTSRGAGGKARDLAPLCGNRLGTVGCHRKYDLYDPEARQHELRLRSLAKKLWNSWKANRNLQPFMETPDAAS